MVTDAPEFLGQESSAPTIYQTREVEPAQPHTETSSTEKDLLGPLGPESSTSESVESKDINPPTLQPNYVVETAERDSGYQDRVTFRGHGKRSSSTHEKTDRTRLLESEAYSSGTSSSFETEKPDLGAVELLRRVPVADQDAASQGDRPHFPQAGNHSYPLRSSNPSPPPEYQPIGEISIPISGDNRIRVSPSRTGPRCIFLCMPSFTSKEQLEHAIISSCVRTDRQMYAEFYKKYFTWWRIVQQWATMRRLSRVNFVRVRPFVPDEANHSSRILFSFKYTGLETSLLSPQTLDSVLR